MTSDFRNPSDAELRVLDVLWRAGAATVRDVANELYGDPTMSFDAARGVMRCGQAVVKEIDADYHPDMKLGDQ